MQTDELICKIFPMNHERRTTPEEWAAVAEAFRSVRTPKGSCVEEAIQNDGRRQAQIAAAEALAQKPLKATKEGNFLVFRPTHN